MYTSTFFFHYFIKGNYFCESLFGTLGDKTLQKWDLFFKGSIGKSFPFLQIIPFKSAVFLWL